MMKQTGFLVLMVVLLLTTSLSLPACYHEDNLSGHLRQLVEAEKRGEAEEYAAARGIVLRDGKVLVIIECEPGQVEVAVETAVKVNAIVELTTPRGLIQAFVPITSLNKLSKARSVKFIRLPYYASEE